MSLSNLKINKAAIVRSVVIAAFLVIVELFVFNAKWMEYHTLGMNAAPLHIGRIRLPIYIVIFLVSLFYDQAKCLIRKADEKFSNRLLKGNTALCKENTDFAKLFAFIALTFGIFLVFFIPPLNAPDEQAHFITSYAVAHGQLMPSVNAQKQLVVYTDSDFASFMKQWPRVQFYMNAKLSYSALMKSEIGKVSLSTSSTEQGFITPNIAPLLYAPQAAGIDIGWVIFFVLGLRNDYIPYNQLIFARLFNLLFYIVLVFFAIKVTPVFKRTFMLVALMPQTLFIVASCSYDSFVCASCFLFTALAFRCAFDQNKEKITKSDIVQLAIVGAMVALCKYVYVVLLLLLLFIPTQRFGTSFKKVRSIGIVVVSAAAAIAIWFIINIIATPGMTFDQYAAYRQQQIAFVLHNPLKYFFILFYNLFINKTFYLSSFVAMLGWLDVLLPISFIALYFAFILISAFTERFPQKLSIVSRVVTFVIVGLSYALMASTMYINWSSRPDISSIGSNSILGLQGRYFIPIAIVGFFLLANRISYKSKVVHIIDKLVNKAAVAVVISGLSITTLQTFMRYYIQ
jgi:uncharacterized membrane protein